MQNALLEGIVRPLRQGSFGVRMFKLASQGEAIMEILRRTTGVRFNRRCHSCAATTAISRAIADVLEKRMCFSTVNVLTAFDGTTDGFSQSGVIASGNMLYGSSPIGGDNNAEGEIYSLPITGGNPDLIAGFSGTNGSGPTGDLLLVNDTLYGVTSAGGASNDGVVFSLPIAGGTPTVIATFNGANGADPEAGLIVSNNILYGTTFSGGANNVGEVFSLPITGGTVSVLASFSITDGKNPDGPLTLADGILYGNTRLGGGFNAGTIYSVPITGGSPTVLADMSPTVGQVSEGPLVLLNNTLYGTATAGGSLGKGTLFKVPITGGTPSVLFNFDNTHGAIPAGGLSFSNGILYGTTAEGGTSNLGTLFGMFPAAGTPTTLASFDPTTGTLPFSTPVLSDGILYGTALQGTSQNAGSVWSLPATTGATLTFEQTPFFGTANTAMDDIQVTAINANQTTATNSTGPFTLSIASGPAGAKIAGTLTVTPVGGMATFSGITVDTAGVYTLQVSDVQDAPGTSHEITVDVRDTFKFVSVPATGVTDVALSPVVVQAITPQGNLDTQFNGFIGLAALEGPIGRVLSGGFLRNASAGVATFSDLAVNFPGSYTLVSSDSSGDSPPSSTIVVTSNPTEVIASINITKSPLTNDELDGGGRATATVTLNNSAGAVARGVMKVQMYLTSVRDVLLGTSGDLASEGVLLNTPGFNHVTVNIPTGRSRNFSSSFVVPSFEDNTGQLLVAVLTPVSGLSLPTLPTHQVIAPGAFQGLAEFGTVDERPHVRLTQSFGDLPVHFSLSGPGKGVITQDLNQGRICS